MMMSNTNQNEALKLLSVTLQNQISLARREISNLRQQLISLKMIHRKECDNMKEIFNNWCCTKCKKSKQDPTEPKISKTDSNLLPVKEIGIISSSFPEKRGTPRQPFVCADTVAKLTLNNSVFTNPEHSVEGLEKFSHMWILFHFHKNNSKHVNAKVSPPRLNGLKTGIFASRSPHRPNPIGLSLVKIQKVDENNIYFSGIDMIDGTPVIDIKPYIPQYDNPYKCNFAIGTTNRTENLRSSVSEPALCLIASNGSKHQRPVPSNDIWSTTSPENVVKIPSWIDLPPVKKLNVTFTDKALSQLYQLGDDKDEKKATIINVLTEDPRSTYLREKWSSSDYVFQIYGLRVCCQFDDVRCTVSVHAILKLSD